MFKLGPDKDSNVFHLSLTEIAFLIILALVLLLGFPLKENLRELDELQNCRLRPEDPSVNVDEPESLLLPCDRCVANRYNVSLEEARQIQEIGHVASNYFKGKEGISLEQMAETMKSSDQMLKTISELRADNQKWRSEAEQSKEKLTLISKKNDNLLEVNQKLKNKLYYGGDFPPCMRGETLRADGTPAKWDSLFRIHMKENRVYISFPSEKTIWHPAIDENLRQIAVQLVQLSETNEGISWKDLDTYATQAFLWSENHIPRCRLAVVLENRIKDRREADEKRLRHIESRFYKQEILEK